MGKAEIHRECIKGIMERIGVEEHRTSGAFSSVLTNKKLIHPVIDMFSLLIPQIE